MEPINFKEISERPCALCKYYKREYFHGILFKSCTFGGTSIYSITDISGCDEFIKR